jgi:hypothetical protein
MRRSCGTRFRRLHFNEDHADCCGVPLVRLDSGAHLFGVAALTPAVAIAGITPNDYEAGLRTEWLNRRLIVNATIYDTEYSDFQVQTCANRWPRIGLTT